MIKKLNKTAVILAMLIFVILPVLTVAVLPAKAQLDPFGGYKNSIQGNLGLGNEDPRAIAARVINVVMGFLGIIAVIIILVGGFQWMTAGGDEGKVESAKKMMTAGVIGLVIILAAWGVTIFVMNALLNATGANVTV